MKNNISFLKIFVVLISLCFTAGCSSDSDEPSGKTIELPSDKEEIELSDYTQPETVTFTATADWSINVNDVTRAADWVTVEPMSGKAGKVTITIAVDEEYDGEEDRKAEIVIQAGNGTPVKILIVQKANTIELLPKKIKSIAAEGKSDQLFSHEMTFSYNDTGKVEKIYWTYIFGSYYLEEHEYSVKYNNGMLSQVNGDYSYSSTEEYTVTYDYEYTNGLMRKVSRQKGIKDGHQTDKTTWEFLYENNRIDAMSKYYDGSFYNRRMCNWQYGNIKSLSGTGEEAFKLDYWYDEGELNNLNVDLWYFLAQQIYDGTYLTESSSFNPALLFNMASGRRCTKLPHRIESDVLNDKEVVLLLSYEKDNEGYITKISINQNLGERAVYTITYE